MTNQSEKFRLMEIGGFLKSSLFLHTLVRLFLFFLILWALSSLVLSFYTNHGQKIVLPNFIGAKIKVAEKKAKSKDFEFIVTDSIYLSGKPGGHVLSQVPVPGSKVKRGRKIYVTVTRYMPDIVLSEHLPVMYGKKLEHMQIELYNLYELRCGVLGYKYDPGPPGHILEIYYKGTLLADAKSKREDIELYRGDTLGFIVSTTAGGEIEIPSLRCMTLAEAKFLLAASKLEVGKIKLENEEEFSDDNYYIINQSPAAGSGELIKMGEKINLVIQEDLPPDCN
jgi:hypothetical protein